MDDNTNGNNPINNDEGDSTRNNNQPLLLELWNFLKVRKVWWLAPIIIMLIFVGVLIIFGQSSALSPFVYALF